MGRDEQPTRSRWVAVLASPHARVLVTVGLLAYVGTRIDWSALGDHAAGGSIPHLLGATGCLAAALSVGALRWHWLLRVASIRISYGQLGRIYAVSTFSNAVLPTAVGGDVTRALLLTRERGRIVRVALTIVVDRAMALLGLLAVAWAGIAIEPDSSPRGTVATLAVITVGVVVGGLVVVWAAGDASHRIGRFVPRRLEQSARDLRETLTMYVREPRVVAAAIAASVVFQLLVTAHLVLIADAFDIGLGFEVAAVTLALVTVATLFPVSIAGFGIREGSYVLVLAGVGISATDATVISLSTVVVMLLASLPGAYLVIRHGLRPALAPP
jgi:glycosyltransferase 2 family protein